MEAQEGLGIVGVGHQVEVPQGAVATWPCCSLAAVSAARLMEVALVAARLVVLAAVLSQQQTARPICRAALLCCV